MTRSPWSKSHFDSDSEEPLGPLANLVDVMLVFICGLIAVLISVNPDFTEKLQQRGQQIKQGTELPTLPDAAGSAGAGMESVGTVYRDPATGKLIMVSSDSP
ncbi:MAG: DUF2149 domain-containing protein [Gammaproteobacteria bacterium]|jgi:hypothetical protein